MSDKTEKIVSLDQARRERQAAKKGRRFPWRLVLLALAVLVVLLILCMVIFPERFNLDRIRRYFSYLGVSDDPSYGQVTFEAGGANAYAVFHKQLAVGSESGLYLYDDHGEQKALSLGSLPNPTVLTSDGLVLCYGNGNSFLTAVDKKGSTVLSQTVGGLLLDADLSSDGCICYVTSESGYKSVATVLNSSQKEIFKWYSHTQYLNNCAVSEKGQYLAVVGLGEEDSVFCSTLTILKTDQEEPVATVNLGNQVIYELFFLKNNSLCAIGQDAAVFLDEKGNILSQYTFEEMFLADFAHSDKGFVVLAVNQNKAGNRYELVTLDSSGEIIAEQYLGVEVRDLSAAGKYIGVLTDTELTVYSRRLEVYAQTTDIGITNQALVREDGTVMCIGSGETSLYIP